MRGRWGLRVRGCLSLYEPLQQPWDRLPRPTSQEKGPRLRSPSPSEQQSWVWILARVSLPPGSGLWGIRFPPWGGWVGSQVWGLDFENRIH